MIENEYIETLKGIVNTAIDGIITIDSRGIVESINPSALKYFDYKESEVVGQNVNMLMPKKEAEAHNGYLDRYLKTRKQHIIGIGRKVYGKKKNGETFPFQLAVSEIVLHDRIIFCGIIHDLTFIDKAQQELKALNTRLEQLVIQRTKELEQVVDDLMKNKEILEEREKELNIALSRERELNELKSKFVSTASHEFRTPLSTILSSATLIGKYNTEDTDHKRQKHIEKIKKCVATLTGVLNDFMSLSKIEEGKITIQKDSINIITLISEVLDEAEGLHKKDQIIQVETDDFNFFSDRKVLKNTLFNLISNALKYTDIEDQITISASMSDTKINIDVTDTGIGIPMADQQYLFQRFYRASNAENIQGTGLGLSIVKKYVELLNGRIGFTSTEGKGSTFHIDIKNQNS